MFRVKSLEASKPELRCGTHRGGAAKRGVGCTVPPEVIFVEYSSTEVAALGRAIIAVEMKSICCAVSHPYCAVIALISMDIHKLT